MTANDTVTINPKFSFKSYGAHSFYSSHGAKDELQDVSISFTNKALSAILDKLEYSFSKNKLEKNPVLNIDYHKEKTTKEKAVKEIISRLKKSYKF